MVLTKEGKEKYHHLNQEFQQYFKTLLDPKEILKIEKVIATSYLTLIPESILREDARTSLINQINKLEAQAKALGLYLQMRTVKEKLIELTKPSPQWKLNCSYQDLFVHTRKLEDSDFLVFKLEGTYSASPQELHTFFVDFDEYQKLESRAKSAKAVQIYLNFDGLV
jgi:hypothetical protein